MMEKTDTTILERALVSAPLLSPSAFQLLRTAAAPDLDLRKIARVVTCDAALTARLLKVVNSAAFGLIQPVSTVERAVAFLGTQTVFGIALDQSLGPFLQQPLEGYASEAGDLWRHNLFTAIAARRVCRFSRTPIDADLAYTGGLLHDTGKAVLSTLLKGTPSSILKEIDEGTRQDYLQAEKKLLGMDHAEAGFRLALHWKLPAELQTLIHHHHTPAQADPSLRALTYAVHLGDVLAMMGGLSTGADALHYALEEGYQAFFDIPPAGLMRLMLEVQEEFSILEKALGGNPVT